MRRALNTVMCTCISMLCESFDTNPPLLSRFQLFYTFFQAFGYPDFKPLQTESLMAFLGGLDLLASIRTGGGKTLIAISAALHLASRRKVVLYCSPLLSVNDGITVGISQHFDCLQKYITDMRLSMTPLKLFVLSGSNVDASYASLAESGANFGTYKL